MLDVGVTRVIIHRTGGRLLLTGNIYREYLRIDANVWYAITVVCHIRRLLAGIQTCFTLVFHP